MLRSVTPVPVLCLSGALARTLLSITQLFCTGAKGDIALSHSMRCRT